MTKTTTIITVPDPRNVEALMQQLTFGKNTETWMVYSDGGIEINVRGGMLSKRNQAAVDAALSAGTVREVECL